MILHPPPFLLEQTLFLPFSTIALEMPEALGPLRKLLKGHLGLEYGSKPGACIEAWITPCARDISSLARPISSRPARLGSARLGSARLASGSGSARPSPGAQLALSWARLGSARLGQQGVWTLFCPDILLQTSCELPGLD